MNSDAFSSLVTFLHQLEQKHIPYTLAQNREEAIMVLVATPGERWEIEFLPDGGIEVERFVSTGEIIGSECLAELFARYTAQENEAKETITAAVAIPIGKVA